MHSRLIAPDLKDKSLTIRLARNDAEIEAANEIVYQSYINKGYWQDDKALLEQNKFFHSPSRTIFVAHNGERVVASASIIRDSDQGLPADMFQSGAMDRLRAQGGEIAEVSALAVDKSVEAPRNLVFFLFKFVYQYSFYYTPVDRFVAVSTPKHAFFYEKICLFQKVAAPHRYEYVGVNAQLLTVHLLEAHALFAEVYEPAPREKSFYRFLLVDGHPNLEFPGETQLHRSRNVNWLAHANLRNMAIAV